MTKEQSFMHLRQFLPGVPESVLVDAVERCGEAGLEPAAREVGRAMGTRFVKVEGTGLDVLGRQDLLPALELGATPRVILGTRGRNALVYSEAGTRSVPLAEVGSEPTRFLVASPRATLAPLKGRSGLGRVLSYLGAEREIVRSLLVYAACVEGLSLAAPLAVQVLINTIGFGMLTQQLVVISVLLFICLSSAAALRILQQVLVEHLSRRFFARTVTEFAERMPLIRPGEMVNPIHRPIWSLVETRATCSAIRDWPGGRRPAPRVSPLLWVSRLGSLRFRWAFPYCSFSSAVRW
jgi:hypothetical protein